MGLGYWCGKPKEDSGGGVGNSEGGKSRGDNTPDSLKQGLVAYYPFNGNAKDESGNGNDGMVEAAKFVADRHGNAGKAFSFGGKAFILLGPMKAYTWTGTLHFLSG